MITIKARYKGELECEAIHIKSGHKIETDAPVDNNGKGSRFSPTDMLSASLGMCMMTIMGIAAENHGFSIDNTEMEITKIMASDPRRVSEVIIDIHFPPNNYSDKEKKIIKRSAQTCPVNMSLSPELKRSITFHFKEA